MDLMGRSEREGFNNEEEETEEDQQMVHTMSSTSSSRGKIPFSSSSSASLSHHQQHKDHNYVGRWLENKFFEPSSRDLDSGEKNHQVGADGFDTRVGGGGGGGGISIGDAGAKEHMFDKVVTPSDVGKLNRLVIPKQHAERYFPLDSATNDKGLILNFEDGNGKTWRFRYSYWNSSQSYVMTKGWSRFVKEKKLDAGDIVSFHRGAGDLAKDRLYIDWRRRPPVLLDHHHFPPQMAQQLPSPHHYFSFRNNSNIQQQQHSLPNYSWRSTPLLLPPPTQASTWVQHSNIMLQPNMAMADPPAGSVVYLTSTPAPALAVAAGSQQMTFRGGGSGLIVEPMVFDSVPLVVQGKANAKRHLRLFGVNMECPNSDYEDAEEEEEEEDESAENATMPPPLQPQPSSSSSSVFPLQNVPSQDKRKASKSLDFEI